MKNESRERDEDSLKLYLQAQMHLIVYMVKRGVIKNANEFADKYAEVFYLLSEGAIESCSYEEYDRIMTEYSHLIADLLNESP